MAEFIFIPVGERPLPEHGEPVDIPGSRYSHHGPHSTFCALVGETKLQDPILQRIARMVDEADEVQQVALGAGAIMDRFDLCWVWYGCSMICAVSILGFYNLPLRARQR